jgi:hypothetical protein
MPPVKKIKWDEPANQTLMDHDIPTDIPLWQYCHEQRTRPDAPRGTTTALAAELGVSCVTLKSAIDTRLKRQSTPVAVAAEPESIDIRIPPTSIEFTVAPGAEHLIPNRGAAAPSRVDASPASDGGAELQPAQAPEPATPSGSAGVSPAPAAIRPTIATIRGCLWDIQNGRGDAVSQPMLDYLVMYDYIERDPDHNYVLTHCGINKLVGSGGISTLAATPPVEWPATSRPAVAAEPETMAGGGTMSTECDASPASPIPDDAQLLALLEALAAGDSHATFAPLIIDYACLNGLIGIDGAKEAFVLTDLGWLRRHKILRQAWLEAQQAEQHDSFLPVRFAADHGVRTEAQLREDFDQIPPEVIFNYLYDEMGLDDLEQYYRGWLAHRRAADRAAGS